MRYLTIEDFKRTIREEQLMAAVRQETHLLEESVRMALAYIRLKLGKYYDVDTEFERTARGRHPMLVKWAVDLAIYEAVSAVAPMQVPQLRQNRHDDAVKELDRIAKGELGLDIERREATDQTNSHVASGTVRSRDSRY